MFKKLICVLLVLTLAFSLAGCSAHDRAVYSYEKGKYEQALERFEALGDTAYVNKCRFMLLYEYVLAEGDKTEAGTYTLYTTCISDLAFINLYADPETPGQLQVIFSITEDTDEAAESYEISLDLSVDDPNSTYQIAQTAEDGDGNITLTTCDGTVDVSAYTAGMELDYTQCQRTVMSATASTTSGNVNRATRKRLFAYFSLAADGLYEMLNETNMGTTTENLGFTAWEYVSAE